MESHVWCKYIQMYTIPLEFKISKRFPVISCLLILFISDQLFIKLCNLSYPELFLLSKRLSCIQIYNKCKIQLLLFLIGSFVLVYIYIYIYLKWGRNPLVFGFYACIAYIQCVFCLKMKHWLVYLMLVLSGKR